MSRIEWDNSFSVNDFEIDAQHKKWIALYNNLHEVLISVDREIPFTITRDTLKAMLDYTRYHFEYEEECMKKVNYPDIVVHRRVHKEFEKKVYADYRSILDSEIILNTSLISTMRNWFLDHIMVEDKKIGKFISESENLSKNSYTISPEKIWES